MIDSVAVSAGRAPRSTAHCGGSPAFSPACFILRTLVQGFLPPSGHPRLRIALAETRAGAKRRILKVRHAQPAAPSITVLTPMTFFSTLVIAFAMSTDAFAAAVSKGAALTRPKFSEALRTGAIFGVIEALTPLVGWAIGSVAAPYVRAWDHWIAFTVLGVLGLRMIYNAFQDEDEDEAPRSS